MEDLNLYCTPSFDFDDLAGRDVGEFGYIRVSEVADSGESAVCDLPWKVDELIARKIPIPSTEAPFVDTLRAYARAVLMDVHAYMVPGRTAQLRVRLMYPKGMKPVRTYTFRASRPLAEGDPPLTYSPATGGDSRTLSEADAIRAVPGLAAIIQANIATAGANRRVGEAMTDHLEKFSRIQDGLFERMSKTLDEERSAHGATRKQLDAEREEWTNERGELLTRLTSALEAAGGAGEGTEGAKKMLAELKEAIAPLAHLVPPGALQGMFASAMGGETATTNGDAAGPFAPVLDAILRSVSPDKLPLLTPDAISARLADKANLQTLLEILGVAR